MTSPSSDPPPNSKAISHADTFAPVLYGLRRRQRAVLAIAALLGIAGVLVAAAIVLPSSSQTTPTAGRETIQWFALGLFLTAVGVAAIALTRLDPRNAQVYLLLKHQPEAIANIFFDVKQVRGYAYEYMVLQTHPPRKNYVVPGIQRFGIPKTLDALRQLCPGARFSCSPVVKQAYFPDEESSTEA